MNYDTPLKRELLNEFRFTKLSESSIKNYIRHMELLNDNMPLKNLNFIKDTDSIMKQLDAKKENTKRNYLISLVAITNLYKNKIKTFKPVYLTYQNMLDDINKVLRKKERSNEMTETQKENFVSWDDVLERWTELKERVNKFVNNKQLNELHYNLLQDFVVLSLYVLMPPRRNDYLKMYVVKGYPTDDITKNFYDLNNGEFIFNNFKTVKKEGQQIFEVPEQLQKIINVYLKFRKIDLKKKKIFEPLLVNYDNIPMTNINTITYILNRIFKKKVSSSMLRHSFITHHHGGEELEKRRQHANMMAHSLQTQSQYVLNEI